MNNNSTPSTPMESSHVPIDNDEPQNTDGQTQEVGTGVQEQGETNMQPMEDSVNISPNKRGLTSAAWSHFRREKIDDKWKAICKYCEKKLGGDTRQGTKGLHDHIRTCKLRTVRGPKQSILNTFTQSSSMESRGESVLVGSYTFNQEEARLALTQMIVAHEYPISMVDHECFRWFCNKLQPLFTVHTRNTTRSDIMKMYDSEKEKILKLIDRNASRIAMTTDMWTSDTQNQSYMSITTHFIDDNWTLQSRLLRFIHVKGKHDAETLGEVLLDTLLDWNLDRKLSTLTVDNCTTNDALIRYVLDKFPSSSFTLGGSLLHMRCATHIINLIVRDGMSRIENAIENVRDSIKYWFGSPQKQEKFIETCRQLNVVFSKKPRLDCKTRWNSTYLMLASTLQYEEVFMRLKQRDSKYECAPSEDDWLMAYEIVDKLEVFYTVTELFSGTQYPTCNAYFPKVCEIKVALHEWLHSPCEVIQAMARKMVGKFDKYWSVINGVMAIGAVLDPRYKMKLLDYFFPLIYRAESSNEILKVKKTCENLLFEYQSKGRRRNVQTSGGGSSTLTDESSLPKKGRWSSNYLQYVQETASDCVAKSELDCYLEEPVLLDQSNVEKFDILGYWKNVGVKYPTLQRIARDFLAIPISTVASESAFSTGGRILSPQRSSLTPEMAEALICTQNWVRATHPAFANGKKMQSFNLDEDEDV